MGGDITSDQYDQMIAEGQKRGMNEKAVVSKMVSKGYTFGGKTLDPNTLKPVSGAVNQTKYPPQDERSKMAMAGQAGLETAGQVIKHPLQTLEQSPDIPGVGKAVGYAREKLPGQIAETAGNLGLPNKVGAAAGLATEGAANLAPKTLGDVALLGAPKLLGGIGKVAGKLAAPASDAFAEILGGISGKPSEYFKQILKDPDTMKFAKHVIGEFEGSRAMKALQEGRNKIGAALGDFESAMLKKYGDNKIVNIGNSFKKMIDIADKFRIRIPEELSGQPLKANRVVEAGPEYESILNHLREMKHVPEMDIDAALALRDKLKNEIGGKAFGEYSNAAKSVLKGFYGEVNEAIGKGFPEISDRIAWKNGRKRYQIAVDLYDKLEATLGKENPQSMASSLASAVKQGYGESSLTRRAKYFGEQAEKAMLQLKRKAVSANFKERFSGGGLHTSFLPSSPRLAARIAQGTGWTAKASSELMDQIKVLAKKNPSAVTAMLQGLFGSGGPVQNR